MKDTPAGVWVLLLGVVAIYGLAYYEHKKATGYQGGSYNAYYVPPEAIQPEYPGYAPVNITFNSTGPGVPGLGAPLA